MAGFRDGTTMRRSSWVGPDSVPMLACEGCRRCLRGVVGPPKAPRRGRKERERERETEKERERDRERKRERERQTPGPTVPAVQPPPSQPRWETDNYLCKTVTLARTPMRQTTPPEDGGTHALMAFTKLRQETF